MYDDLGAVFIL